RGCASGTGPRWHTWQPSRFSYRPFSTYGPRTRLRSNEGESDEVRVQTFHLSRLPLRRGAAHCRVGPGALCVAYYLLDLHQDRPSECTVEVDPLPADPGELSEPLR